MASISSVESDAVSFLNPQILQGILIYDYYRIESIGEYQLRVTNSKL